MRRRIARTLVALTLLGGLISAGSATLAEFPGKRGAPDLPYQACHGINTAHYATAYHSEALNAIWYDNCANGNGIPG